MNDQFIFTEDLCRYYQRGPQQVRAVDNVNLQVAAHEFLAIVGASGSGKSTILNLLAGLDTPTSGKITSAGKVLSSLSRKGLAEYRAKKVGIMFQSFNLIHHRTALENVELALYFNNTHDKERKPKAREILDQLGLSDRISHKPSDLSGGEQQRVALARALVKGPEILFADEPTGNLDQENAKQIMALLTDLNTKGLTIIMVTHDIEMVKAYAHRIVRMHYGRVVDSIQISERGRV